MNTVQAEFFRRSETALMVQPRSVLFAIPELNSGGPDRVFYELLQGINRSRFKLSLAVIRGDGRYYRRLAEDIDSYVIGGSRYPAIQFSRIVDQLRPDLIFTTLRMNATAAAARRFQSNKPVLVSRQPNSFNKSFLDLKKKSLFKHRVAEIVARNLLRVPEVLVAQSSLMAEELRKISLGRQKIVVLPNPISVITVNSLAVEQNKNGSTGLSGSPAVVAAGRLEIEKGFDLLIKAFACFLSDYPKASLTILGEGSARRPLEQLTRDLGIDYAVNIPGKTDQIYAKVSLADIFVSSARHDAFPNTILEAMALARPVVATNCEGGTKDMIIDGRTGILVRPSCHEALAEGLSRMMRADRADLGRMAQRHVENNFSREKIIAAYEQCFEDAISIHGSAVNNEN